MKIIVCVKQVPDTSGKVAVNPDGTLNRASMATITNPDDLNAVEAALALKDQTGAEVVVISMGPPPAEGMLREILARGADRAVLVSAREFGGSDTYATSQILAAAIKKVGVDEDDIVFCGHNLLHDLLHQKFLIHKTCCLLYWNETVTACGFLLLSTSSVSLMWSRADSA